MIDLPKQEILLLRWAIENQLQKIFPSTESGRGHGEELVGATDA